MCSFLGKFLYETLFASWTWVTGSFPKLGKFSVIFLLNIFSQTLSFFSSWDPYNVNISVFNSQRSQTVLFFFSPTISYILTNVFQMLYSISYACLRRFSQIVWYDPLSVVTLAYTPFWFNFFFLRACCTESPWDLNLLLCGISHLLNHVLSSSSFNSFTFLCV